jgi:hypothetical protein
MVLKEQYINIPIKSANKKLNILPANVPTANTVSPNCSLKKNVL